MANAPIKLPKHIPELDGLRAFAILPVLAEHAFIHAHLGRLSYWSVLGWMGVDLFFVLSGFLITGILLDSKGSEHFFRNFYGRRTLRIWPLYYAYLLLVFYVLPNINHALAFSETLYPIRTYAFYLQNVLIPGTAPGPLAVTWSLAIEEHFYLIWPVIVYLSGPKVIRNLLIGILVFTPVMRFLACERGASEWLTYTFTLFRMDTIAFGCFLAYWLRSGSCSFSRLRAFSLLAVGSTLSIACAILLFVHKPILLLIPLSSGFHRVWIFSFTGIGAAGLVGLALSATETQSWLRKFLNNSVLRYIGKTSYGIYLFHFPVFILCAALIDHFVEVVLAEFVVLAIATFISWHFFEQPILRLKSKLELTGQTSHALTMPVETFALEEES